MLSKAAIKEKLPPLPSQLTEQLLEASKQTWVAAGTKILDEQQYVNQIPIVIEGLIKVYSTFEQREMLLYYIEPSQSCVMSFYASLKNKPSQVSAVAVEDSVLLVLPVDKLPEWLQKYPGLGELFYDQYDMRYTELLETIEHLLVDKLDVRLYNYLLKKQRLLEGKPIALSHTQIANELGTVREVVSRLLKKLEAEQKITLTGRGIKALEV